MITKVVVSAAGQGTRMLELTKNKSKHLIEVQERPFLAYLLDNILKAGYTEIIIVAGFREDLIKEFLITYKRLLKPIPNNSRELLGESDYIIKVINQFDILGPKEKEYGTACPIKCVKDIVGRENFISIVGDNYYSVEDLAMMNIDDNFNYVAALEHEQPEKFGVVVEKNGLLEKIAEKPKEFLGNLINTSLYKFTPEIFDKIFEVGKSPRGEYEITDAITSLAKEGKFKVKKMTGFWMDLGKPEDIEKFREFINKKQ